MAIIVENLNMPNTCTMCWLSNICELHINDLKHEGWEHRLDGCPLREVVHGEWIKKHDEYWNVYWYECSVCGRKPPNDTFGQEWQSNYCPNCGADMRGDEDD